MENVNWSDRPKTLKDFPANTQIRLRQLEPHHTITVHLDGGREMLVRRVGVNKFVCGEAVKTPPIATAAVFATAS